MGETGHATGGAGTRRPDRAPRAWRKIVPFEAAAASDRLGWVGLEAARYREAPASELNPPALDPPPARPLHPAAGGAGPAVRGGEAARTAPRRIDLGGAGRQPGPVALERAHGLAPRLPGAGAGRAGRRRGVRPRPGAADGPAARRPGPPAPPGRDAGGGCRADGRRRRGAARRRVAGQRPGRPPDPARPRHPAGRRAGGTASSRG